MLHTFLGTASVDDKRRLDLVSINAYAKFHHNILLSSRDRAIFFFSRIWSSAKPRLMTNIILQSFGLDLVNINVYANQNTPNGSRVMGIFRKLNWGGHTTSQTDRGRTQAIIGHTPKVNLQLLCRSTLLGSCNFTELCHGMA